MIIFFFILIKIKMFELHVHGDIHLNLKNGKITSENLEVSYQKFEKKYVFNNHGETEIKNGASHVYLSGTKFNGPAVIRCTDKSSYVTDGDTVIIQKDNKCININVETIEFIKLYDKAKVTIENTEDTVFSFLNVELNDRSRLYIEEGKLDGIEINCKDSSFIICVVPITKVEVNTWDSAEAIFKHIRKSAILKASNKSKIIAHHLENCKVEMLVNDNAKIFEDCEVDLGDK